MRMTWIIIEINLCEYKIDKSINKIEFCVFVFIQTKLPFSLEMSRFSSSNSLICFQTFESIWFSVEWCVSVCEYIKRYIEWYIVISYWFIYSLERSSWMRVVFDFNASASDSTPFEPIWFPVEWCVSACEYIKRYIEWYIVIWYWFIYSPLRSSWMRVGFDFNASASDSAPFESIWFPVEWRLSVCIYKEIYWVIYCYIILIYLLTSKIKLSESCVWFQCFSKWFSSFWTNLIPCWMMCQCVYI
jgi:hypothetical protein